MIRVEKVYKTNLGPMTLREIEKVLKNFDEVMLVLPEEEVLKNVKEKEKLLKKYIRERIPSEVVVDDAEILEDVLIQSSLIGDICSDDCPLRKECQLLTENEARDPPCFIVGLPLKLVVRVSEDD